MNKEKTIDNVLEAIDLLAAMTKKGFDNTVSKEEFNDFKEEMTSFKKDTEKTLFVLDGKIETIDKRLDAIDKTLGPLVQISGAMQHEIRELNLRVSKLEHEAGFIESL